MNLKKITSVLAIAMVGVATISAQNLQSVSRHGNMHDDLLASQTTITDQIRLSETKEYMDIILQE